MTEIDWKLAERGDAHFSDERPPRYRYALSRVWAQCPRMLLIVGLNPSTADENKLDQTLRKCVRFADREGYGGLWMGNLFAYRATKPADMKAQEDPVGINNDHWLTTMAQWCGQGNVIAAWGTHGVFRRRDEEVKRLLRDYRPRCLGTTQDGHPCHPLYLRSDTPLVDLPL